MIQDTNLFHFFSARPWLYIDEEETHLTGKCRHLEKLLYLSAFTLEFY